MAKGPTVDELMGVCLDRADRVVKLHTSIDPSKIIDLSGGGGGKITTFSVSTAASIVVASAGVYVAKQAAPAVTGYTGSIDVLNEIGVDIPLKGGDPRKVIECLEKVGIVMYYYSAFSTERFENFLKWRETIKRIGLGYLTPWHLVSFVYSPINMKNRVYGLFTDKYLRIIAELFKKFNYKRALIFHGIDGLDEVSNVGPTKICELKDGKVDEYTITPAELGIKAAKPKDIMATSREGNIIDFLRVLYARDKGPKRDLVAVNAGAALYIMGKARDLKNGTELTISLVEEHKASNKLEELVNYFGGQQKLRLWKKRANL
jgi:anthranilate phosphoribosyltransferase